MDSLEMAIVQGTTTMASECAVEIGKRLEALDEIKQVTNDSEARLADSAIKAAKATVKTINGERMVFTRKLDEAKKRFMAREAEISKGLNDGIARVQQLTTAYLNEKARQAEEARLKAEEERRKAEEAAKIEEAVTGEKVEVAPIAETPKAKVTGVKAREYWGFKIVDPNAVPRAYCAPDTVAINAYKDEARKNGAKIEDLKIAGVEFYKEFRV